MIVTYPIHPLSYASSAYGDYATAREAEAGITGEWFWLGIYDAGHQFEINQLMLGFDTSNKPALPIADVTLELPIEEAYGLTKVVILHYDWIIGDGSYVKGSEVDSLPILAEFTVNEGDGGSVFIKLNASELPDISRLALVPEAMRYPVYDGSGDDTTLIIDTGVKLHVTFKETPAIEAEVEGILEAVAVASGSPVVDSSGVAAINLNGGAEAVAIVNAAMTAYVPLMASGAGVVINGASGAAQMDLSASLVGQSIHVARGQAAITLMPVTIGSPVSQATLSAPLMLIATATASMSRNIYWIDPDRVVEVPASNGTAVVPHISTRAV